MFHRSRVGDRAGHCYRRRSILGVEHLVAKEFVDAAVILVRAGLYGYDGRAIAGARILRAVVRGQHLDFLNGVNARRNDQRAVILVIPTFRVSEPST